MLCWFGLTCWHLLPRTFPDAAPTYNTTATATAATQQQQELDVAALAGSSSSSDRAWQEIQVPAGLGLEATRFKWRQNLSHVEVFVRLPGSVQPKQVGVLCLLLL
jgi:hypothetical protein